MKKKVNTYFYERIENTYMHTLSSRARKISKILRNHIYIDVHIYIAKKIEEIKNIKNLILGGVRN